MNKLINRIKRWDQKRKVNKINKEIESLSWNMQFEELTIPQVNWHNNKLKKLRILRQIEEGILEHLQSTLEDE